MQVSQKNLTKMEARHTMAPKKLGLMFHILSPL